MIILFSEEEWYYRDLGLEDTEGVDYVFGGMKLYNKKNADLIKYGVFVCAYYTMPHNILLTNKFNALGIQTILCCDGIFDFSNAMFNEMHRKYNLVHLHPILQRNLICVGKKESEYFRCEVNSMDYIPKRMISSEKACSMPEKNRVLLTTANTAYFNDSEYKVLLKLILDTLEVLYDRNINFSIRIFDIKLLSDLEKYFSGSLINDIDEGFEDTLLRYSSVITTPSSVAVVSMFHKRPTALLIYRDVPMFLQAGWLIPSSVVLSDFLDSFLHGCDERMIIQNRILENYSSEYGISERIFQALNREDDVRSERSYLINKSYENMLNSHFNFNFEWFVRRLYRKLKKIKFLAKFINILKRKVF